MKKILVLIVSALLMCGMVLGVSACDSRVKVRVLQYAEHGSLDNCYEGIVAGLEEKGYGSDVIDITRINAKGSESDNTTYASSIINESPAVAVGIATPSAYALASAARGDVPVVFTAVSDPTAESANFEAFDNVTGSSDKLPVESQLKLITDFFKTKDSARTEAVKIGIIYTRTEANSVSHIAEFKALASQYNVEIVEAVVDTATDIPLAIDSIIAQVDCFNNLTDNNVVQNLDTLLDKADAAGKPVFGSEIEQVKKGCLASCSLDYFKLGKQTGYMIAEILGGKSANDIEFLYLTDGYSVDYNSTVAQTLGFTLPSDYEGANDAAA